MRNQLQKHTGRIRRRIRMKSFKFSTCRFFLALKRIKFKNVFPIFCFCRKIFWYFFTRIFVHLNFLFFILLFCSIFIAIGYLLNIQEKDATRLLILRFISPLNAMSTSNSILLIFSTILIPIQLFSISYLILLLLLLTIYYPPKN